MDSQCPAASPGSLVAPCDTSYYLAPRSYVERVSAAAVVATVLALAAVPFALASLPVLYGVISLAAVILVAGLASQASCDEPLAATEIYDTSQRATYNALLAAHIELAKTLERAREPRDSAERILEHSRKMVVVCGRIAQATNAAARYLDGHGADAVAADCKRLRAQATGDCQDVLTAAAKARSRQHAAVLVLERARDRARARLELALSSLHALNAALVKRMTNDAAVAEDGVDDGMSALAAQAEAVEAAAMLTAQWI